MAHFSTVTDSVHELIQGLVEWARHGTCWVDSKNDSGWEADSSQYQR
ncbi:hypothetical protein [Pseudarthrobacter sp. fls2-241-R2A-168]|nr:hypothetical protein [Pseudarthrobacter sp. fls2-241-R2A-168]